MNGKQSKKLRELAAMFFMYQPPDLPQKPLEEIYKQLKKVHKSKGK